MQASQLNLSHQIQSKIKPTIKNSNSTASDTEETKEIQINIALQNDKENEFEFEEHHDDDIEECKILIKQDGQPADNNS